MLLCILLRREVLQALMRPESIVEVDPLLSRSQKLSQGLRATPLSDRELERPDKALGGAVIRWGASSAHRELEALLQQELTGGFGSKWLAPGRCEKWLLAPRNAGCAGLP